MPGERSTFTKAAIGFGSAAFMAVLGWLCLTVLSLSSRLDKLESGDTSNWGTLSELRSRQIQLEIQLETVRRVFEYEYQRHIPRGGSSPSRPGGQGKSVTPPDPGPPLPHSPPALEFPDTGPQSPTPLDPEQFRADQMRKYPAKK